MLLTTAQSASLALTFRSAIASLVFVRNISAAFVRIYGALLWEGVEQIIWIAISPPAVKRYRIIAAICKDISEIIWLCLQLVWMVMNQFVEDCLVEEVEEIPVTTCLQSIEVGNQEEDAIAPPIVEIEKEDCSLLEVEVKEEAIDLSELGLRKLRRMCKDAGCKGFARWTKAECIAALS